MKKPSLKGYFLYIIIKVLSKIFILLPPKLVVFQGRVLGILLYYLNRKQRSVAHRNLRMAFAHQIAPGDLRMILKKSFQNFGMSLVETLIIPKFNQDYMQKNIQLEGLNHIEDSLKQKKGVILLGIHMGSWEVCFAVAGILGLPFYILVEEQRRFPLLDRFLNQIRKSKGVGVLVAGRDLRKAIQILKENKILGLVADHGIKEGVAVEFFGHRTFTPTLFMELAFKSGAAIVPGYIIRKGYIQHRIVILPPFPITRFSDYQQQLIHNLKEINRIFENCIRENPADYFWFYRRFKYNLDRTILVLEDEKKGHQKQLDSFLEIAKEVANKKGLLLKIEKVRIDFKNNLFKILQIMGVGLAKKIQCRDCLWCLRKFLKKDCFLKLSSLYADMVVSCGSSLAGINFVISSLNQAKSIVIMRPSILSTKRFDLVIAPLHDQLPKRKNILSIDGALSFIDERVLEESKEKIGYLVKLKFSFYIGVLIGGNTKDFQLKRQVILDVLRQLKQIAQEYNAGILLTTSRRTPKDIENLIKEELKDFLYCGLLVIANERNYPFVVEGILGLSRVVIVSPESISMITEAVSSKRYVLVFKQEVSNRRHRLFLENFYRKNYIYLIEPKHIASTIKEILFKNPALNIPDDRQRVFSAIERIL